MVELMYPSVRCADLDKSLKTGSLPGGHMRTNSDVMER